MLSNSELEQQATDDRNNGRVKEAVDAYRELVQRFETAGESLRAAEMQHMVGVSYKVGNHTTESLAALQDALARYRRVKSHVHEGRVLRDIGITYQYARLFSDAQPYLEASVEILMKTDDAAELGISQVKLGHFFHEAGRLMLAKEWIERGLDTLQHTDHWFYRATALLHLADLQLARKEPAASLESIESAEKIVRDHDGEKTQRRRLAQLYYLQSAAYKQQGNTVEATRSQKKADAYAAGLDDASKEYLYQARKERKPNA